MCAAATRSRSPLVRSPDDAEPHPLAGRPYDGSAAADADRQPAHCAHCSLPIQGQRYSISDQRRGRRHGSRRRLGSLTRARSHRECSRWKDSAFIRAHGLRTSSPSRADGTTRLKSYRYSVVHLCSRVANTGSRRASATPSSSISTQTRTATTTSTTTRCTKLSNTPRASIWKRR
jgi:hypothetical protein